MSRLLVIVLLIGMIAAIFFVAARQRPARFKPAYISSAERTRQALFKEIQPVALKNCQLQRFGEANDGGYLMCANLLSSVQSAYSYGISGYDGWGCDISRRFGVRVHQYDCFDTRQPACAGGDTLFHTECIGPERKQEDGRVFDTLPQQIAQNGDAGKSLVVKMDVERAEWDSLLATPNAVLDRFAQFAIELHGTDEVRFVVALQKLKEVFYVAHVHYNNHSCLENATPFPAEAYEVLLVNKRLAELDPAGTPSGRSPLDAPNDPASRDCQARHDHLPSTILPTARPASLASAR